MTVNSSAGSSQCHSLTGPQPRFRLNARHTCALPHPLMVTSDFRALGIAVGWVTTVQRTPGAPARVPGRR